MVRRLEPSGYTSSQLPWTMTRFAICSLQHDFTADARTSTMAAPQSVDPEADLRRHIHDLESQLDAAYDKLSNLTGNGSTKRPAKRLKTNDDGAGASDDRKDSITAATRPTDARIIRWQLQQYVDKLTDQVRENYEDGYEEQWETKLEWYDALASPLQHVLDIGVGQQSSLKECNDILMMVADSFDAITSLGSRMDTREELSESGAQFDLRLPWDPDSTLAVITGMEVENVWMWVWIAVLRTHANIAREEDRGVLLQCIKDADSHIVKDDGSGYITLKGPLSDYLVLSDDSEEQEEYPGAPDGAALTKLVKEKESEWKKLNCKKKTRVLMPRATAVEEEKEEPAEYTETYSSSDGNDFGEYHDLESVFNEGIDC